MPKLQQEIARTIPHDEAKPASPTLSDENRGLLAFHKLVGAKAEIRQYIAEDFDPGEELGKARAERYGDISC